jgi:hypothetical protein
MAESCRASSFFQRGSIARPCSIQLGRRSNAPSASLPVVNPATRRAASSYVPALAWPAAERDRAQGESRDEDGAEQPRRQGTHLFSHRDLQLRQVAECRFGTSIPSVEPGNTL